MKNFTKTYGMSVKTDNHVVKRDRVDWLSQSAMPSSTHSSKISTINKRSEFSISKSIRR